MNKKQKIIVSITGIILVLLILVGLTYAYFLTRIQGNTNTKSISVTTADLRIVYADGTQNIITKQKIQPGEVIGEKDFTVTNEGNSEADYIVVIDDVIIKNLSNNSNTTFNSNDFVYTLTCVQKNKNTGDVSGTCDGVSSETSLPLYNNGLLVSNNIAENMRHEYVLTVTYKETGINQTDDMNKKLEAKVDIKDIKSINPYSDNQNSLAYNIINNAKLKINGTELRNVPLIKPYKGISKAEYLKGEDPTTFPSSLSNATNYYISYADDYIREANGKYTLVEPTVATSKYITSMASSLVGKYAVWGTNVPNLSNTQHQNTIYKISTNVSEISSTINYATLDLGSPIHYATEKELSVANDDYGNSYYYRGGVEDNYVDFATMCWRIVRIEGDGSIKLILEDQDQTCASSNGNWNIPTTTGGSKKTGNFGYTKYDPGTLIASDGVTTNSDTLYILDYLHGQTDSTNSMAIAFKNFQNGPLSGYLNKLKSGNWCMDDKGYSVSESSSNYSFTELSKSELLDKQVNTQILYDSFLRLVEKSPKEPMLICNGTVMHDWDDNELNPTSMYVGTLTADEIVFAGGIPPIIHYDYYLINGQQLSFWTLSPAANQDEYYYSYRVNYRGTLSIDKVNIDSPFGFRPSIQLKSGTTISGGDGTKTNPYVIN